MVAFNSCPCLRTGVLGIAVGLVLLLAGCGGSDDGGSDKKPTEEIDLIAPIPTDTSARADSLVQHLVSRYLSYAYQGATLRSTHPLNDSLFALKAGKGTGGPVMLVDTFYVDATSISHDDSIHTVRVEAPHALTVSKVWGTSNPRTGHTVTIQIQDNKVARAPRIVGWPALRAHVLKVESDSGEAIVNRLRQQWTNLTGQPPAV